MRVGGLDISPAVLLAPMEAVTDLPFRTICEELGAALTFTEFLSAEALTRGAAKTIGRMWPSLGGRRFAVQIFGREPEALARAAGMAVDVGAAIVDINMGCPAKKVTAGACGSALMREPALAAALVAAVRRAVPDEIPVTVKHRAGWDEGSLNAAAFARQLVDAGAAMITVHGRTRAQGFSGTVRLEPIAAARAALPREIPVVGNGDVKDVAAYARMKAETGCDGVMIGRGAMGNPWLFRTLAALERGAADPGPHAGRAARGLAPPRRPPARVEAREDPPARAAPAAPQVLARALRRVAAAPTQLRRRGRDGAARPRRGLFRRARGARVGGRRRRSQPAR